MLTKDYKVENKSTTFCPAKWTDLVIDPYQKYSHACCRATPVAYTLDPTLHISTEQDNLLHGVQDETCQICWKEEKKGFKSARHLYQEKYPDVTEESCSTTRLNSLEINVGNLCNFGCAYCGPKFSTVWSSDITKGGLYNVAISYFDYANSANHLLPGTDICKLIHTYNPVSVNLIGGEPLIIPEVINVINNIDNFPDTNFNFITNLSKNTMPTVRKLYAVTRASVSVSLDCTGVLAEFIRDGLNYNEFIANLTELIANTSGTVTVLAILNNITIYDIKHFVAALDSIPNSNKVQVLFNAVDQPSIHSFNAVPPSIKNQHLALLSTIQSTNIKLLNLDHIVASVQISTYNEPLHKELVQFYAEYAARRNKDITHLPSEVQAYITQTFTTTVGEATLCIGNSTDDTNNRANIIAHNLGLTNNGILEYTNITDPIKQAVYHTSLADIDTSTLLTNIQKFKNIIIFDQPVTSSKYDDITMHEQLLALGPAITAQYNIPHTIIKE